MVYGDAEWHKKYMHPSYVNEGQEVIAPVYNYETFKSRGVRCVVTKACGNHCQVENTEEGFCKWYDVMDLVIEKNTIECPNPHCAECDAGLPLPHKS